MLWAHFYRRLQKDRKEGGKRKMEELFGKEIGKEGSENRRGEEPERIQTLGICICTCRNTEREHRILILKLNIFIKILIKYQ